MIARRVLELIGMLIIGDGVLALIAPHRHPRLWLPGPKPYQRFLEELMERPLLKRFLGVVQIGFGTWLASLQWKR